MNWREFLDWQEHGRDVMCLFLGGISLLLSILQVQPFIWDMAWVAILLCGVPIVLGAVRELMTELDIRADVLVSIALVASVIIGEIFAAGEVAFIMQLGALLEELTVHRARAGIASLVKLTPRKARLLQGDKEDIIAAEQVKVGDILRVLPGETVPVVWYNNVGLYSDQSGSYHRRIYTCGQKLRRYSGKRRHQPVRYLYHACGKNRCEQFCTADDSPGTVSRCWQGKNRGTG